MDYQDTANRIGETLRAAEQAAEDEGANSTAAHLTILHEQLGHAFLAANELGAGLDWNQVAGNAPSDGDATRSGGTGKNAPTAP